MGELPQCTSEIGRQSTCITMDKNHNLQWPDPTMTQGLMVRGYKVDSTITPRQGAWGYLSSCGAKTCDLPGSLQSPLGFCGGQGDPDCKAAVNLDVMSCSNGSRAICKLEEPTFTTGAPTRNMQKVRNCCVNTYDTTNGFPQSVVGNGCGSMLCPKSQCCKSWAAALCLARGKSLTETDITNPDPKEAPWAVKGEALCDMLAEWDFNTYANVMEKVCMTNNSPNEYTRSAPCIKYFNNPETQKGANGLSTYCRTTPVQPDTSSGDTTATYHRVKDDDLCGCFRGPEYYATWNNAVNTQWAVPPGVLDVRPMCSYPGCRTALVQDQLSVTDKDPCKPTNVAVCMQEATVDNSGKIGGSISISQNCPQGSKIVPRYNASNKCTQSSDCLLGQVCDNSRMVCTNPSDSITECTSDAVCVAGMQCGPVAGDGKRYCQAKPAGQPTQDSNGMPPWQIALIVVGSVVGLALIYMVLRALGVV